ncbi:hypothetical protein BJX70DRAFT_400754 [Aspergillus crustosus]
MVNWKDSGSQHRLMAAVIAANPNIKFDHHAVAALFGRGATHDSINHQLRSYKKLAEQLRTEAASNGVDISNLASIRRTATGTPRTLQGGITKTPTSSTAKGRKSATKAMSTPTKSTKNKAGIDGSEAIHIDSMDDDLKDSKATLNIKAETGMEIIHPSIEGSDFDLPDVNTPNSMVGVVIPVKREAKTNRPSTPIRSKPPRAGKSSALFKDADGDEQMGTTDLGSPTVRRGRDRPRVARRVVSSDTDVDYE